MKMIGEGAEAKIYKTTFMGIDAVAKDRIEKRYREKVLDLLIRKQRTTNEARCTAQSNSCGANTPKILCVSGNTIIMSMLKGKNLSALLKNRLDKNAQRNLGAWLSETGRQLALLHKNSIIHGDYTPANIIVGLNNVIYVIDFGLSEISTSVEGMALDVLLMKRSLTKKQFSYFSGAYRKSYRDAGNVFSRMADIELRGRYRERSLLPASSEPV
jgi:Kae1-associated kinase Bud32